MEEGNLVKKRTTLDQVHSVRGRCGSTKRVMAVRTMFVQMYEEEGLKIDRGQGEGTGMR